MGMCVEICMSMCARCAWTCNVFFLVSTALSGQIKQAKENLNHYSTRSKLYIFSPHPCTINPHRSSTLTPKA